MARILLAVSSDPHGHRSAFVGRARELGHLAEARGRSRLVTLVGPPGAGKTRMASECCAREPGSLFCDLTAAGTLDALLAAMAGFVGAQLPEDRVAASRAIGHALARRAPALVVLDNFEQLVDHAALTVALWLELAPGTHFIVTSREALRIDGETLVEIGGLDEGDSIRLYAERALAASAAPPDPDAVRALVRRLDGLPLAIELAAARARVAPAAVMLERIAKRPLDDLRTTRRDAPQHHASLRAAIAVSWALLSPEERTVLGQCTVFRGGFDLSAADAIVATSDSGASAAAVVASLVDRSLVRTADARLDSYESVRAFARERMEPDAELSRRHATYYVERAETYALGIRTFDGTAGLAWVERERENLTAALEWARASDPAIAIRTALALYPLLEMRGPRDLFRGVVAAAVGGAARIPAGALAASAYLARARMRSLVGELDEARADLDQAVLLAPGDAQVEAYALALGGAVRWTKGDLAGALPMFSSAIERAASVDARMEAWVLYLSTVPLGTSGAVDPARERLERALRLLPDDDATCDLLRGALRGLRGWLAQLDACHADAIVDFEVGLTAARRVGDRRREGTFQFHLGQAHVELGDRARGRAALTEALTICEECGYPHFLCATHLELGAIAWEEGRRPDAETHMRAALEIARGIRAARLVALAEAYLAALSAHMGRMPEAREHIGSAREKLDGTTDPHVLEAVDLLEGLMEVALAREASTRGDDATAQRSLADARARASRVALAVDEAGTPARLLRRELLSTVTPERALRLGSEARWIEVAGTRVDFARRGPPRRILLALAERAARGEYTAVARDALIEIGWPGERILPHAAVMRLHQTIRSLREVGLEGILMTNEEGYHLDPAVEIVFSR